MNTYTTADQILNIKDHAMNTSIETGLRALRDDELDTVTGASTLSDGLSQVIKAAGDALKTAAG